MTIAGEDNHGSNDPLLKPGSFIDPNPKSNGNSKPVSSFYPPDKKKTPQRRGSDPKPDETPLTNRPDWLPPDWNFVERVRTSGATAGTRDKYFLDPVTNRRFRSKKEVLTYLEGGSVQPKKKNTNSDRSNTPQKSTSAPKRKKSEQEGPKDITKYFNFDDVPVKVRWELTDIYEGDWIPLVNGVETVPESMEHDWFAAFTYLTIQNDGR